ncbi:hypothetical protein Lepto7375DRAFT_0231 [Leptolyngbya sp. PCC 7375]|nr:hypothetical protein Lepto7375DRAFT_0231 [Leptolyngbya sp. PCC 7375]
MANHEMIVRQNSPANVPVQPLPIFITAEDITDNRVQPGS